MNVTEESLLRIAHLLLTHPLGGNDVEVQQSSVTLMASRLTVADALSGMKVCQILQIPHSSYNDGQDGATEILIFVRCFVLVVCSYKV